MRRRARVLGWFEFVSLGTFVRFRLVAADRVPSSTTTGSTRAAQAAPQVAAVRARRPAVRVPLAEAPPRADLPADAAAARRLAARTRAVGPSPEASQATAVLPLSAAPAVSPATGEPLAVSEGSAARRVPAWSASRRAAPPHKSVWRTPPVSKARFAARPPRLNQGSDVGCWLGCFGGDIQKAIAAYSAVTCVVEGCGMQCSGAFGP